MFEFQLLPWLYSKVLQDKLTYLSLVRECDGRTEGCVRFRSKQNKTTNEAAEITASATSLVAIGDRFKIGLLQTTRRHIDYQ